MPVHPDSPHGTEHQRHAWRTKAALGVPHTLPEVGSWKVEDQEPLTQELPDETKSVLLISGEKTQGSQKAER